MPISPPSPPSSPPPSPPPSAPSPTPAAGSPFTRAWHAARSNLQLTVSAGVIALIVLWGLASPATLGTFFGTLLASITRNFGWLYLWVVLGLVGLALFLALSRYGDLKLGDEDEEPEFSTATWFAMLFAAGMGIGLVFWGVAEPVSHYGLPPPGVAAQTPEAAGAAMRYAFFHWGLHPWAIYGVVGLAIAFFQFRRQAPALVSSATESLPWRGMRHLSPLVNVLAVVATAFGVAASLGMGAAQINGGLQAVFGIPVGPWPQAAIIVVTTAMFITSAVSGVDRGIKWLSSANLLLAALLALAVFLIGPTVSLVNTFTNTLGAYLSEFVRTSLRMSPFRDSSWVGDWTIFYWSWWIAWSPFVGLFIARVSRGRTIREFVLGTVIAPSLVGFMWFSIFGGTALHLEIFQQVPLSAAAQADPATAMFAMFSAMPLGMAMSIVATVLVVVFFVTSGDSATLVLGTMSTRGDPDPSARVKIAWGLLVAGIALSLLFAGGLQAVQTATIVFALPFALVLVLMAVALLRAVREDHEAERLRERALRRRMREMVMRE
ncbi:BCCT family transporter [Paracidovorax konjaci]|uniref:Glycine betaine transporter n=1 Tax=Paracidovorax konjaci TaxID=32040 RepID=A0A1I1YCS4_9BURK|nr:glycine betaine transporter [Paracidovorax konjaci]